MLGNYYIDTKNFYIGKKPLIKLKLTIFLRILRNNLR